ncbi:DegT/DnrJ/EryC1/StrS family aminotransferase [Patescibacteria group bacterium]|nr:DegT/DnrJ/EryC1/StrS family aminotransferase [Patescibacteria group bacterium]
MKRINQMEPWVGEEEKRELIACIDSGWITEAERTYKFEKMVADFVGSRYGLAANNGTVSLTIALMALGIGRDDEVIIPDMTMVATPNAVLLAGATPILVDIKRDNLCLDLEEVMKKISKKTKAIMPVAMNARPPDMDGIERISREYNLFIVEDSAQALGSYYKGKHLGTFGEIGSFSFSTPKIITTGQGGVVVTDSKRLRDKMYRIKDFGRIDRKTQKHDTIGWNFKFSDIQAAVGIAQMKKLEKRIKWKRKMYRIYQEELRDVEEIKMLPTDLTQTTPWFVDIFVDNPKMLKEYLNSKQIGTREFYPAIHSLKPYRGRGGFPVSTWASKHGLWLPSSLFLTKRDIKRVCKEIKNFFKKKK